MTKRLTVVRAPDRTDRAAFVDALGACASDVWITDPDPRPPTAVIVGDAVVAAEVLASFEVDDRVVWDEPIPGDVYSMFAFFRWAPDVGADVSLANYREHAELARVHHPGIRVYVQDVVVEQSGHERWRFDAISELHFSGVEEFRTNFYRDESSRAVIARDVTRFSDGSTSKAIVGARVAGL